VNEVNQMSHVHKEHKEKGPKEINFSIITVSTSRALEASKGNIVQDISGDIAHKLIQERKYKVVFRTIVPDDIKAIKNALQGAQKARADIIIFIGGTGLTRDDLTIEAIKPLLQKEIPGFGEIFRYLSYLEIGSSAFLSRALAGTIGEKAVFCLPGSPNAVKLALEKLILEEAGHLVYMLKRK